MADVIDGDGANYHVIVGNNIRRGDVVLAEVISATSPNVLIGGNPISAEVLQGFGWLATRNMRSGENRDVFLEPGSSFTISPDDTYYRVTNLGDDPIIYRDECEGFTEDYEPTLDQWRMANPHARE